VLDALSEACRSRGLAQGYDVHDAIAELAGGDIVGWKIAATSIEGQKHIDVSKTLGGRLRGHATTYTELPFVALRARNCLYLLLFAPALLCVR